MDPIELRQSLRKALADIEHSVEGALILGRHASDSVAQLKILCEAVVETFEAKGHMSEVGSLNSATSQHSSVKFPAMQVNGMNGITGGHHQIFPLADDHAGLHNANAIQRTTEDPLQIREPMATHQSLHATNARLLGLMEHAGSSHTQRSEQKQSDVGNAIQIQVEQLAAKEAQFPAKEAEIATKDEEITSLNSSSKNEVGSPLPEGTSTFKPQASLITQAPAHGQMSTHANQNMLLHGYLLPTFEQLLQQKKAKQIALAKEQDSKDAFEAFMRTMQNSNSGLYEKLTDSSGHYVSPSRSTNAASSIQDRPRKVPETKLNPETPPFMPLSGQFVVPSIAGGQNKPERYLKAPAAPRLEVIVESTDEDTTEAQIKEKAAFAKGESAAGLETALPSTSPTTVKGMAMHDSSASAKDDAAVSLPHTYASFNTFVEQHLQASIPIPASSSAEVSSTVADSPSQFTPGIAFPQEPRGVDDLIDLSSNATSPSVSQESVFRNAATDSAAYVAAATSAYSSFNSDSYARRFKTEPFSEEDGSEVTNTDQETSSDEGQFVWDNHGYSGLVSFSDRLNKTLSTFPESKASIRRFFSQAYAKTNPSTNPWSHDDVNQYVIRPESRGTWYEMPLNWVPAEGESYYMLDPKEPLLGWDGQAWR